MKHNVIHYSMIVLLIGLVALAAGRTYAQTDNGLVILGVSFGISAGQTARVNLAHLGDGPVRFVSASIQHLDAEGNVIAQSDEIRVEPGKMRYWDTPREQLPAGELTGRIQVRTRIFVRFVTTEPFDVNRDRPPLTPSLELIDSGTGRTVGFFTSYGGFLGGVTVAAGDVND